MAKESADEQDEKGVDSNGSASPEVNIDDLEISVLMLVKNPRHHESAANFLSRRGWPTKTQNNLQKAIKQITAEKPDFVLISLNFPHPALMKLVPLFKQSFGVEVVLFNESQDATSVARLAKVNGYKITGAPSGPCLQRTLRRILQEKLNPAAIEKETAEDEGDEDSTVRIRGEGGGKVGGRAYESLAGEYDTVQTASYTLESETVPKKKKKLKDVPLPASSSETDGTSVVGGSQVGISKKSQGPSLADLLKQIADSEQAAQRKSGEFAFMTSSDPKIVEENGGVRSLSNMTSNKPVHLELSAEQEALYAPLHQAVLSGVEKLCDQVFTDWTGIEPTSELYVLPVLHQNLHGYLVVKLDEPVRSARTTFFNMISGILHEKVRANTEALVEDGIDIGIPVVNFKNWVDQTAVFKVGSEYFGTKFCVAFLKTDQPLPEIKKMGPERMLKVAVEEISTEYPVNFKAYIRLEKNKKFFLYLKSGRYLLPEQKERLKENNVSEICVKQIDEANLKKFLAFVQLRESMLEALKIAA